MGSNVSVGTTPDLSHESGSDQGTAGTQFLLGLGILAGPFYLGVGLIQAFVRDGFDLARHPLSLLANGPGGWVQTANFVLGGLMVIAAAVGFARVMGPKSRAVTWFLGGFGAGMIVAAVFPADPVDGFPIGTPEGYPTSISTPGLIHFIVGTLGFVALAVSCFLAARAMSRRNVRSLARLSFVCGLVVLLGFFGGAAFSATLGIWLSVLAGWTWLAVVSFHFYRVVSDPSQAPRAR